MTKVNRLKASEVNNTSFLKLPKFILRIDISCVALVLYAHIRERIEWSVKNEWMNKHGEIYCIFTREDMCAQLHCSQPTIRNAISQLKNAGLIDEDRQGLSKPNRIYLCAVDEDKEIVQSVQKEEDISFIPECKDSSFINKEINKTNYQIYLSIEQKELENQTAAKIDDSLPSSSQNNRWPSSHTTSIDTYSYNKTLNHVKKHMDYDILLKINRSDRDNLDEMLHIITETLQSSKPFFRINGENIHASAVKARLMNLNSSHLEYVIECLGNVTDKIRNVRAYLLTSLYNAPTTINSYYRFLVNHDFACCVG